MPILRHCLASIRNLSVGLKEAADSRIDMYVSTVDRGGRDAPEVLLGSLRSLGRTWQDRDSLVLLVFLVTLVISSGTMRPKTHYGHLVP